MDHTRDNPLKRFTAFWVALLLVTAFGIACILIRPLTHAKVESATQDAADARRAVRADIDRAQSKALDEDALEQAMKASAEALAPTQPDPATK